MDGEHPQIPAESVLSIDLLQARLLNIDLENLPNPVFGIGVIPFFSGVKYVGIRFQDPFLPLAKNSLLPQEALDFVGQTSGQMAGSGMLSFGVFSREENGTAAEVHIFGLNPDELTDTTTQFIDRLEHELMPVVVDTAKELGQFVEGEISYDFAELLIRSLLPGGVRFANVSIVFLNGHLVKCEITPLYKVCRRSLLIHAANERFINFRCLIERHGLMISCLFKPYSTTQKPAHSPGLLRRVVWP